MSSGRCATPPEIITLPDFEHAIVLQGDSQASAKVTIQPIDADGNGLIDAVVVNTEFVAPRTGPHRLTARFASLERSPSFPGVVETHGGISEEVAQALPSGPVRLRLRFDPEELERLHKFGPVILTSLEIQGPGGFRIQSMDEYVIGSLPPREEVPFRYAGESAFSVGEKIIDGSFAFLTPGGACVWKGELEQGSVRLPFSRQDRLKPGRADIAFRVDSSRLREDSNSHAAAHLTSLECGGRIAYVTAGEKYLVEVEVF